MSEALARVPSVARKLYIARKKEDPSYRCFSLRTARGPAPVFEVAQNDAQALPTMDLLHAEELEHGGEEFLMMYRRNASDLPAHRGVSSLMLSASAADRA